LFLSLKIFSHFSQGYWIRKTFINLQLGSGFSIAKRSKKALKVHGFRFLRKATKGVALWKPTIF